MLGALPLASVDCRQRIIVDILVNCVGTQQEEPLLEVTPYQLRAHLEGYGARLAAARASEANLTELTELIERMHACAAADDLDGLVAADVEFHRQVCKASGSRRLLKAWETLNPERWTMISSLRVSDLSLEQIAERHRPILAALQARKPDHAESIIREHILELGKRVLAGLAERVVPLSPGD